MEGTSEVALRIHQGANGVELSDDMIVIVETEYEQGFVPMRYR